MNKQGVQLAINKIADDVLALSIAILEDDSISVNTKVNKNTLRDSALKNDLAVRIGQTNGDDPVIGALFNNYVVYIEWDRPPQYGKQPPISALKDWAAKNGIPTDANTLWAISYAIWRDGHTGRPIFATLDRETDFFWQSDWAEKLYTAIITEVDLLFND